MVTAVPLARALPAGCHRGLGTILFTGEWGQLVTLHGCHAPGQHAECPHSPFRVTVAVPVLWLGCQAAHGQ